MTQRIHNVEEVVDQVVEWVKLEKKAVLQLKTERLSQFTGVKDALNCQIHYGTLVQRRQIAYDHTFCLHCIRGWFKYSLKRAKV